MTNKFTEKEEQEILSEVTEWRQSIKKERITPYLPAHLVEKLKSGASSEGKPYNLYLQEILEKHFFDGDSIELRLERLERAVFKSD